MKKRVLSFICAAVLFCSVFPPSRAEEGENIPPELPVSTEAPAGNGEVGTPESSASAEAEDTSVKTVVQVGLYYGSNAMDGANLENNVGTGYRLGYMDENRIFQPLGYTEESMVSVIKSENVWYGTYEDYTCYFDNITSDIMIGCWYVQIPAEVSSFEDVVAFINGAEGYFPAWINGEWQVRYGSYPDQATAAAAAEALGGTAVNTSGYGVSVVRRGTARILFQFDGGDSLSLAVNPGLDDSKKAVTWLKGNRYYGIFQYRRVKQGGNLTISNFLPLDDYAECVISREMSASWPIEALKAQAVCARNYYEQKVADHRHRSQGFDICNTTCCQVYFGMASTSERTAQAVAETSDLWIWYEGEHAEIYYYSSNGGATEACKNVWVEDRPYLVGQIDPYESTVADQIYHYNWTVTYTAQEIEERLRSKGYTCGTIVDYQITARTDVGNVRSIVFIDANGKSWPFYKDDARTILGLRSLRYRVTSSTGEGTSSYVVSGGDVLPSAVGAYVIDGDGNVTQVFENAYVITASGVEQLHTSEPTGMPSPDGDLVFTIQGTGTGHHVGMSQWGAYAMAKQGMTYEDILTFYFPGVEIYAESRTEQQ